MAGSIPLPGLADKHERPKPPTRKPVVAAKPNKLASSNNSRVVDLLGDDTNMEMSGWEALKPS